MKAEFDFENIKNKAIEQLKTDKPLLVRMVLLSPYWKVLQKKNVSWVIVVIVKCRSKSRLH